MFTSFFLNFKEIFYRNDAFDFKLRRDVRTKGASESYYEFLDRSSLLDAQKIRVLINKTIGKMPKEESVQLVKRIKSKNDNEYKSAMTEIYVHSILLEKKCSLTIHPDINGSNEKPDFLVKTNNGDEFYLEVVTFSGLSDKDRGKQSNLNILIDKINEIEIRNYYISMYIHGLPTKTPSYNAVKKDIENWIIQELQMGSKCIEKEFYVDGVTLTIKGDIKSSQDSCDGKFISSGPRDSGFSNHIDSIRGRIKKKASKYGKNLDKPLVLLFNSTARALSVEQMEIALLGDIGVSSLSSGNPKCFLKDNGAIRSRKGFYNKKITAIWFIKDLDNLTCYQSKSTIFLNPASNFLLPEFLKDRAIKVKKYQ